MYATGLVPLSIYGAAWSVGRCVRCCAVVLCRLQCVAAPYPLIVASCLAWLVCLRSTSLLRCCFVLAALSITPRRACVDIAHCPLPPLVGSPFTVSPICHSSVSHNSHPTKLCYYYPIPCDACWLLVPVVFFHIQLPAACQASHCRLRPTCMWLCIETAYACLLDQFSLMSSHFTTSSTVTHRTLVKHVRVQPNSTVNFAMLH